MTLTPTQMRSRAKTHLANWRAMLPFDPENAREELAKASNLAMLAGEIEDSQRASEAQTTRQANV